MKNKKSEATEKTEMFKENKTTISKNDVLCTAGVICMAAGMLAFPCGIIHENDALAGIGLALTLFLPPVLFAAGGHSIGPTGI